MPGSPRSASPLRRSGAIVLALGAAVTVTPLAGPARASPPAPSDDCLVATDANRDLASAQELPAAAACVTAANGDGSQDVFWWTVPDDAPGRRWTLTMSPVAGQAETLEVHRVTVDDAGLTLSDETLASATAGPGQGAAITDALFPPGRYIVGAVASGPGAYRLDIAAGAAAPAVGDVEPNDSADQATVVTGAFALVGDRNGTSDVFAWELDTAAVAATWEVRLQVPLLDAGELHVRDESGTELVRATTGPSGVLSVPDIGLPAGRYEIEVVAAAGETPAPYILSTTPGDPAPGGAEAEPNDLATSATPIEIGAGSTTVGGRLATVDDGSDVDMFRAVVGADAAGRHIDVKAFWRGGSTRELCLLDADGNDLQCGTGEGSVAFNDVVVPAGEYLVTISGDAAPDDPYLLRFDVTETATSGFEAEPNDSKPLASPLAADGAGFAGAGRLVGRGATSDTDTFSFTVTGEPQLWEIIATGAGVQRLDALDVLGSSELTGSVVGDSLVITDLFLLPGDHALDLTGTSGDYTVTALPLGPPDPRGEHEPNNGAARSQAIQLGQERFGRLPVTDDVDYYRFSLRNESHVVVAVDVPPGAQIAMALARGGESIGGTRNPVDGTELRYDAVLPPGDYSLSLSPVVPSDERYSITVTPADPFVVPDDAEPNNTPPYARPIAADWTVRGSIDPGDPYGDVDWYALPAQASAGAVAIEVDGDGAWIEVRTAATADQPEATLTAVAASTPGEYTVDAPADVPLLLSFGGEGDYEAAVTPVGGPPAGAARLTIDAELVVTWQRCDAPVAAYWPDSQRLVCALEVANNGSDDVDVTLDAAIGNFAWTVAFDGVATGADERSVLSVPAGETAVVPALITVAPDAWADDAVLVTARATSARGMQTASTTVVPDRAAIALDPTPADPVAPELLGGLDVGATGLGAAVVAADETTAAEELLLHDGLTPLNLGWTGDVALLPLELTVDLAGDDPVPVAGFTLDPRASNLGGGDQLRDFDIDLSVDGATWTQAISGRLLAVPAEQSFVLPAPVAARFARLRVRSVHNPSSSAVVLGEWTVVASPGWAPAASVSGVDATGGIDIGSPERGGHVVDIHPGFGVPADFQSLLVADGDGLVGTGPAGGAVDIVIGFHHDRAAQVAALTWTDPSGSSPTTRLAAVDVAVSVSGPAGPWVPVGTWMLDRSSGAVDPFELPPGTWARFVRLRGMIPSPVDDGSSTSVPDAVGWEVPERVGVVERAVAGEYRSILGSWGVGRQTGQYERVVAPPVIDLDPDAGDTAAAATPLPFDHEVDDTAWVGRDEDWYHVVVPAGESAIAFTVGGTSSVDVDAALFDVSGEPVDLEAAPAADGIGTTFTASVEPDGEYDLQIVEPPTSVVFAFDTSMSIGPYTTAVYQGVTRYAGDVQQDQEAVNVFPFGGSMLLDDWSDEPYLIQAAVNNHPQSETSSDAEGALLESLRELAERPGARAIVLVTDAQTTASIDQLDELWPALGAIRPRIYAVHVAGGTQVDQDLMEDWASVNNGLYTYVTDQGGMDVAFDRAATALRRPSYYSLSVAVTEPPPPPTTTSTTTTSTSTSTSTSTTVPAPGALDVGAVPGGAGGGAVAGAGSASVALILDTSGSMLQQLPGGGRRIEAARAALTNLVTQTLPPGTNVSLRVFGASPDSCETTLLVPQSPLDPAAMAGVVGEVPVVDGVRTPIAASLQQMASDLGTAPGPKIVVLVTDGEETCGGDPGAVIAALAGSGVDVRVNIVGFALDDAGLKALFEQWARLGNGQYIDAADQAQLTAAIAAAVQPTYDVVDGAGTVVASGQAGGGPIPVPAGDYTVVLHTAPQQRLPVTILAGQQSTVQV